MILLIDNFDSFTYNLRDYFLQLGVQIVVHRNDVPLEVISRETYEAIVLSPGPGLPENSGNLMEVLDYYHLKLPVLGIYLGHQAIGEFFGANLTRAHQPMHGKISNIEILGDNFLFNDLEKNIEVVRYHSLILNKIPNELLITSQTENNEIMSSMHKSLPISGIQFHPEAYLTKDGMKILQNWITFYKLVN